MKKSYKFAIIGATTAAMSLSFGMDKVTTAALKEVPAIKKIAQSPLVIKAITTSNRASTAIHGKALSSLEAQWRTQLHAGKGPLLTKTMQNPLAQSLKTTISNSSGAYLGAIVMNNKGLNVAQTIYSKNYSQQKHVIWQRTYKVGSGAIYISRSRFNKHLGKRMVVIAVPVLNQKKQPIGAFAMDVNFTGLGVKEAKW